MLIHKFGYKGKRTTKSMNLWDALRMGFFQLLALLPGVSRSGSTLTGGMLGGLDQKSSKRFLFLYVYACQLWSNHFKNLNIF